MKTHLWLVAVIISLISGSGLAGCGGSAKVDSGKLTQAFQGADPAIKAETDKAVAALNSRNFPAAFEALKNAAKKGKLTPEQEQAIYDTLKEVQTVVAKTPRLDTHAQDQATEDLIAALEGREPRKLTTEEAPPPQEQQEEPPAQP